MTHRRLISLDEVNGYEDRLRAAVAKALAAQVDDVNLTLHRHGLVDAHLVAAAKNPDGSKRKKATAAATAGIVVATVWSQAKWIAYVNEYLEDEARSVATDAALAAGQAVPAAATWGISSSVDSSTSAVLARAVAAGQAIGGRLDAAGLADDDLVTAMQASLDSAGSILGNIVGAMGQALGNVATTDIATYVAANGGGGTKMWNTMEDDKVRPDHEDADGQEVALSESFSVGGEDMDGPGDPDASDEQTINCRCWVTLEGI